MAIPDQRPEAAVGSPDPPSDLDLFGGDAFDRFFNRLGLPSETALQAILRGIVIVAFSAVPLVVAAWLEGHLVWRDGAGVPVPRMSLLLDVPLFTQIVFFSPFATAAELFMIGRMRTTVPHLHQLTEPSRIDALVRWANRAARSKWMLLLIPLAYLSTWMWARTEISNGLDTWHTVLATSTEPAWLTTTLGQPEWFTFAGLWVAAVSLPIFTFLWLRWVWKIGVWTVFLARVSRLKLNLKAVHPDRTGGLGSITDVQTSFWFILLGTGVLFAAFVVFKLEIEGGNRPEQLWGAVLGYSILAPTAFLAPLFLFTSQLRAVRDAARARLQPLAVKVADVFQSQWLSGDDLPTAEQLKETETSNLADLHAAFRAVEDLRVVPLDRRSVLQLFSAAALPFTVLAALSELPRRIAAFLTLLG